MTSNRPRRPSRSRRRLRSRNPNESLDGGSDFADTLASDAHTQQRNVTSAAAPTRAARHESPPTQRHRLPTEPRPRRSRPRAATLAGVVLALALIGGVVFAGIQLVRTRHSAPSQTAAKPTGLPTHAMAPTATSPPLGCGVPASFLTSMSPRDKLAQLLMVGVTDAADARRVVATQRVGGIFVASWTDLSMLRDGELTAIARTAGPLALAVSVDEEGGRVERLSSLIGTSPSARVLAQTKSPEEVYQLALERGRKMRNYGITIDFAPVVDVTNAPDDTVIGDRSFDENPAVVTQYAGAYAKGLRDAGLLPVLKHFPGHGHASGDSHTGWVVTPPLDDLKNLDLGPYRTLVGPASVGVMIGHMQVPGLTGSDPASLSPAAVALLRNGTGYGGPPFDGPVFTDDLSTMKAITERYTVAEAALKALKAGADTALWVSTTEVPAVLDRLVAALANGELSTPKIDASVRRMAKAKALSQCGH
jgi:beta-N-acetylhexosaminidase